MSGDPPRGSPKPEPVSTGNRVYSLRSNAILEGVKKQTGLAFPNVLTDEDLQTIYERSVLGHRDLAKRAADIFNKWFELEGGSETVKQAIEELNRKLQIQKTLHNAFKHAMLQGVILVYKNYQDSGASADLPVSKATDLKSLNLVFKRDIVELHPVRDLTSERFGLLESVDVAMQDPATGSVSTRAKVDASRLIHIAWDPLFGSLIGQSFYAPGYDMYTVLKNADRAMGETFHRNAAGVKIIDPGPEATQAESDALKEAFKDIDATSEIGVPPGTRVETLRPAHIPPREYTEYWLKVISDMPETLLLGSQAGKLTGSETNLLIYFGDISAIQENLVSPILEDLYEELQEFGILPAGEMPEIKWLPLWELDDVEKANLLFRKAQAASMFLASGAMTIGEVREQILDLDPLMPEDPNAPDEPEEPEAPPEQPPGAPPEAPPEAPEESDRAVRHFLSPDKRERMMSPLARKWKRVSRSWTRAMRRVNRDTKRDALDELRTAMARNLASESVLASIEDVVNERGEDLEDAIRNGYEAGLMAGVDTASVGANRRILRLPQRHAEIPVGLLDWWEENSTKWSTELPADTIAAIKSAIREGFAAGESVDELEARLRSVFTANDARYETIALNETMKALSEGRLQSFRALGVGRVVQLTTADERRCPQCTELDGREVGIAESSGLLPVHVRCRCVWIAMSDLEG